MESEQTDEQGTEDQVNNELLARVRELTELQRQLEGLEQVTATLQAAFSPGDGSPGPAVGGRPREVPAPGHRSRGIMGLARHRVRAAEETSEAAEDDDEVHPHVTCDGCHAGPTLRGRVMHCADCEDFDLCARCYHSRDRLGHPRSHRFHPRPSHQRIDRRGAHSQLLMQMLESAMLTEALRRSVEGDAADEAAQNRARGAEVFASLPRQTWSPSLGGVDDGSHGHECALCLEDYKLGDKVLMLPCAHFFHEDCVEPWFAKSLLCPLCQQEASSASEGAVAAP